MPTILLVEDSRILSKLLKRKITDHLDFEVVHAETYAQAKEILEAGQYDFFLALLDLMLPDASDGEVVDLVLGHAVPVVVFSSEYSDDLRDRMENKSIVDYVVKQGTDNVDYIVGLLDRIYKNRHVKALVVEDSRVSRSMIVKLLQSYQFEVLDVNCGSEAVRVLKENPDIALVITDYIMPEMDGFELLHWIRNVHGKGRDEVAVIGVSAHGSNKLSARFIKSGGNDFLTKPFLKEEFVCRVLLNIGYLESLSTINEMARRDFLTGLYNRRHLFDVGEKLFNNAARQNLTVTVAVLDIDHFKKVNDEYGHYAGDLVLKEVARLLDQSFRRSDMVARIGGEEFCVMATNVGLEHVFTTFDRFRQKVERMRVGFGPRQIQVTVSVGITNTLASSLEEMLDEADRRLYQAKRGGRNQVIVD